MLASMRQLVAVWERPRNRRWARETTRLAVSASGELSAVRAAASDCEHALP
jgi:hypothetical protein